MFDILRKVPLFADLPDEDLDHLCTNVQEQFISAGTTLIKEGENGDRAFVIVSGEIEILKESGGRPVLLAIRKSGDVIGEMSLLGQAPRFATGVAKTDCNLIVISHQSLDYLLDTSSSAARVMLSTITNRLRNSELVLRQSEKMAQIGTLTAGIAHELNNPASAARRGSDQLRYLIEIFHQAYLQFHELGFSNEQWLELNILEERARKYASQPLELDSLSRSDREQEIEDWLATKGVDNGWDFAPSLVSMDIKVSELDEFQQKFPGDQVAVTIKWLCTLSSIFSLLEEIYLGTTRIGEIIKSLKSYVYLDQASVQIVDLHEGLDNTLTMLRGKLKSGITVDRQYGENIPKIQAYGSELNQVWTNIIDNAVDAMDGKGSIKITTKKSGDSVLVDIEDSGPGIPVEIQDKLFSPFFTTKPMGKGTGLGLNISFNIIQKHKGEIKVFSRPGKTCFSIRLPVNFDKAENAVATLAATPTQSDEYLKDILIKTKNIAVVGISNKSNSPSNTIPSYLQNHGYRIFPVNPNYAQVLGVDSFPDLLSITDPVDVVLIFRRSDIVPEIVRQAIEIKAKVVWMQEGIMNQAAADIGREAGLGVVMNTCMRQTHQRLCEGIN